MRTLATIEALEEAIRLLERVQRNAHSAFELRGALQRLCVARDEHYREELKAERTRAQIRELSAQRRQA